MSSKASQPQEFTAQLGSNDNEQLSATAFFRGRKFSKAVPHSQFNSITVEYDRHPQLPQSITLEGDRFQRSAFVFVFDCSGTMGYPEGAPRIVPAKVSFKTVLDELCERNSEHEQIWVGAWFFGHRANYRDGLQTKEAIRKWATFPSELTPINDVESVLTIGRYEHTQNIALKKKVDEVEPWGETPLYLALVRAVEDLRNSNEIRDPNVRKIVIAVTDGLKAEDYPSIKPEQVIDAANGIEINILGFNVDGEPRALKEIATKTGGSYDNVQNQQKLLTELRERLQPDMYEVIGPGTQQRAALRESVPIKGVPLPNEFTVKFRDAKKQVRLEGGEALHFLLSESGRYPMFCEPYDDAEAQGRLFDGEHPSAGEHPLMLRVHRPLKFKSTCRFPVSLQIRLSGDEYDFTRRPAESWLEVKPLTDDDKQLPYVFYDVNYLTGKSAPAMEWTASNWPSEANLARIQYWCKYDKNKTAVELVRLRDLIGPEIEVSGVTLSAKVIEDQNPICLEVVERHRGPSPIDTVRRVSLGSGLRGKESQVRHEFVAGNDETTVTHSFFFPPKFRGDFESGTIEVAKADAVKAGALRLSEPLTVSVSETVDSFTPEETASSR